MLTTNQIRAMQGLAATFPVCATLAPKAAVILLTITGLFALFIAVRASAKGVFPKVATILFGIAVAWLTYKAIATFNGVSSLNVTLKITVLIVLGFLVSWLIKGFSKNEKYTLMKALSIGVIAALTIIIVGCILIQLGYGNQLGIEISDQKSIFSSGLITVTILTPSIALFLRTQDRTALALSLVIMVIFVSLLVGSLASSVALAAAVVAGGIMFVAKSHGLRIIAIVSVAVTLSMPITLPVLLDFIDDNFIEYTADGKLAESTHYAGSITHRFLIWRFALEKINQHNVMGLGLDTSRNLPGGHTNLGEGRELMPLHPHNALLQIWLELGIPGLIIFAAGIWACYTAGQPGNQTILMQSARATTLVIILVIMASTFGAWQSWWNSTVIIAIASLGVWQRDKTN